MLCEKECRELHKRQSGEIDSILFGYQLYELFRNFASAMGEIKMTVVHIYIYIYGCLGNAFCETRACERTDVMSVYLARGRNFSFITPAVV